MKVIIYADFNCVFCYLASQRADRLMREGTAQVDWRAVEHLPRLPVSGYKPRPGELQPGDAGGEDDMTEAARLALPDERLPTSLPAVISNTRAAVSAYAEAITDGIQDRLRLRLFESIWAQGRNMSSAQEVRRVVTGLVWPADPIYPHLVSPDLPISLLHDPDPMRIVRREGGTITPDGGPLTTAAYHRARQWRQQWLALFEPARPEPALFESARPTPALPAVIGPDGAFSAALDQRLVPGDRLRVSGPFGQLKVRLSHRPMVMIAGGSGLAPIESMAADLADRRNTRPVTVFFGVRTAADLFDLDRLEAIRQRMPGLEMVPVLSEPAPVWAGETGLVTDAVNRRLPRLSGYDAYLCGPPAMIDAAVELVTRRGVRPRNVYFDAFVPTG